MERKKQAYKIIKELVNRFGEHIDEYKRGSYSEAQTRIDYINPFFKALGWDMDNEQGLSEAYREVIHEYKIKVDGATKAPDYCFTVYGQRKFFVDAKKPSIDVKANVAPAYQVRRYGWSAKLPIAVVTDFEEFSIYDCSKKPKQTDRSSVERIRYLTYNNYLNEFDFIYGTFAKESVLKGSFDKFVLSDTKKKGTATVDDEFLKSIEEWRTYLASTIALRNKKLSEDEINYAVQKTIDRIIFLRICEDRGIEQYGELKSSLKDDTFYKKLFNLFHSADEKYNSGLFDFKEDTITPKLKIDDKAVKKIINELYYPESPYEFSVLPADILGSVYERFLGKTIRLTKAHYAKIEEKPEVRKAGGVYYTPKYIVDYIVENTVGKLLKGKKPKDVEKLKIVDPACGSGSFLIGTYQNLLDWHMQYYEKNPPRKGKNSPLSPDGNLTTAEKKRILLNNIYGVDIDAQAVEVTKLNLLLKALEGETKASIDKQLTFFNERVLPNLEYNIKCGNSLIGTDFYDEQPGLFTDNIKKINAFDWDKAFPEIFKNGGFDAVIGNPPYVRQELISKHKSYFKNHYKTYHGIADLYQYFIEKGVSLLNKNGVFSFIVANKWMRANYGQPMREWLKTQTIHQIIDFGDLQIFKSVSTYPSIIVASKESKNNKTIIATEVKTLMFDSLEQYIKENMKKITKELLDNKGWSLSRDTEINLQKKLLINSVELGKYVERKIYRGLLTGLNEAFVINEETKNRLIKEDSKNREVIKPFLAGRDIKRFKPPQSDKYLILFEKGFTKNKMGKGNPLKWFRNTYPAIAKHFKTYSNKLEKRLDKGNYWWELRACDYFKEFEKPKIMLPDIAKKTEATYDNKGYYCVNTAYIIPVDNKFLLGVLNSKLITYYYSKITSSIRGGYFRFIRQYLEKIPISKKRNPEIVKCVEDLLHLNKDLHTSTLTTQRQQIQRAIDHAERKIDELVYELYGLSEEEVRIIEEATSKTKKE